jgi:hypothetical protein
VLANQAELAINTWHVTNIAMVRVCLIVGDPAAFWVSPEATFRVPDGNHPWLNRQPSESVVISEVDVPKDWQGGDRAALAGFTGFDSNTARNLRLFARNFQLGTSKTSVELGTCKYIAITKQGATR